jgi:uncharacterized membrane protein YqiK
MSPTTLFALLLWIVLVLFLVFFYKWILRIFGIVLIPEDSIGIVNKKFALFGKTSLPDGAIIALEKEAGIQADTLPPGVHFWLWPWQYEVKREPFTTVQEGQIGVVESLLPFPKR